MIRGETVKSLWQGKEGVGLVKRPPVPVNLICVVEGAGQYFVNQSKRNTHQVNLCCHVLLTSSILISSSSEESVEEEEEEERDEKEKDTTTPVVLDTGNEEPVSPRVRARVMGAGGRAMG